MLKDSTQMISIDRQIELGKDLLKDFYRLDSSVINQQLMQDKNTRDTLIDEIDFFKRETEKYIDSVQEFVNSKKIIFENRQHEYVNDYEVGSPALRDFYSYGLSLEQIIKKLQALTNGAPKDRRKQDGKFHYIAEEKIIYRNCTEFRVRSQQFKSESICEVVFKRAPEWVPAIDIGDKQEEKYNFTDDISDPYEWIRPACNRINKAIRKEFEVEFDLLEKEECRVRLSPRAM